MCICVNVISLFFCLLFETFLHYQWYDSTFHRALPGGRRARTILLPGFLAPPVPIENPPAAGAAGAPMAPILPIAGGAAAAPNAGVAVGAAPKAGAAGGGAAAAPVPNANPAPLLGAAPKATGGAAVATAAAPPNENVPAGGAAAGGGGAAGAAPNVIGAAGAGAAAVEDDPNAKLAVGAGVVEADAPNENPGAALLPPPDAAGGAAGVVEVDAPNENAGVLLEAAAVGAVVAAEEPKLNAAADGAGADELNAPPAGAAGAVVPNALAEGAAGAGVGAAPNENAGVEEGAATAAGLVSISDPRFFLRLICSLPLFVAVVAEEEDDDDAPNEKPAEVAGGADVVEEDAPNENPGAALLPPPDVAGAGVVEEEAPKLNAAPAEGAGAGAEDAEDAEDPNANGLADADNFDSDFGSSSFLVSVLSDFAGAAAPKLNAGAADFVVLVSAGVVLAEEAPNEKPDGGFASSSFFVSPDVAVGTGNGLGVAPNTNPDPVGADDDSGLGEDDSVVGTGSGLGLAPKTKLDPPDEDEDKSVFVEAAPKVNPVVFGAEDDSVVVDSDLANAAVLVEVPKLNAGAAAAVELSFFSSVFDDEAAPKENPPLDIPLLLSLAAGAPKENALLDIAPLLFLVSSFLSSAGIFESPSSIEAGLGVSQLKHCVASFGFLHKQTSHFHSPGLGANMLPHPDVVVMVAVAVAVALGVEGVALGFESSEDVSVFAVSSFFETSLPNLNALEGIGLAPPPGIN